MAAVYERDGGWHPVPAPVPLRVVIRNALLNALAFTDGDQARAARLLDVSPRVLNYHLVTYGIPTAKNGVRKRES